MHALTPTQIKDGKGGHKLPLRLKLTKSSFDTPSDEDGKGGQKLPLRLKLTKMVSCQPSQIKDGTGGH